MAQHVAIKCTYNNGGEGVLVGFNGACTEDVIKQNIESGRVWCNDPTCLCRKYYDRGFKGEKPDGPCNESRLFRNWEFGAGTYRNGKRKGEPIPLPNVVKGKIAILTTRFPTDKEEDRKIIGFYKISEVHRDSNSETLMEADDHFRVRLPIEEAKGLYFWDYYRNKDGGAKWGTGLVRYLTDYQVAQILADLKQTLRDEETKRVVSSLLSQDLSGVAVVPPSGPRSKKTGPRLKAIALGRKYGGPEGPEHKKLKQWVADNPASIGLTDVEGVEVEYYFPSGDTADILFRRHNNRDTVVEIETVDPLPGCYQSLKYRVLRCAERGLDVKSLSVTSVLVAWEIPPDVREFCGKYDIRLVEKKL